MGRRWRGPLLAAAATAAFVAALALWPRAATTIPWAPSYEAALRRAHDEERLLVVHFFLAERPLARKMDEETFRHPEVARRAAGWLHAKVDAAERPELLEEKTGGRAGLATCVLDGTGDVVSVLPGFASAEAYLAFLERAGRGYPRLRAAREAARPERAASLLALGEAYFALGSFRRAEQAFEATLRAGEDPAAAAGARERRARLRALRGRNREAAEEVAAYRALDPDNRTGRLDRILLTEGLICRIERRAADGARILERALEAFPASEEADRMLLALGDARHEAADDAGALEALQRLLREHPESSLAPEARLRIEHIRNPPPGHEH